MLPRLCLTAFDHVVPSNHNDYFSICSFDKLILVLQNAAEQKIMQVGWEPARTGVGVGWPPGLLVFTPGFVHTYPSGGLLAPCRPWC